MSGQRYFSPELGRWISRDPIGEYGGPNPSVYVGNRVIDRTDFLGLTIAVEDGGYSKTECRMMCEKALAADPNLKRTINELKSMDHPATPTKKCLFDIRCEKCSNRTSNAGEGGFYGPDQPDWAKPWQYWIVIWSKGTWSGSTDPVRTLYHEVQHAADECKGGGRPTNCKQASCYEARARYCSGMSVADSRAEAWLSAREYVECIGETEGQMTAWASESECPLTPGDCYVMRPPPGGGK